jgi:two-component system heavy metal sensor histidine kinase CusS
VEASRTNSRENHGLGLAIVKAIAEMHRGSVSVQSANGVNTFAFSIAASRVESVTPPARANVAANAAANAGSTSAPASSPASYSSLVKGKSA